MVLLEPTLLLGGNRSSRTLVGLMVLDRVEDQDRQGPSMILGWLGGNRGYHLGGFGFGFGCYMLPVEVEGSFGFGFAFGRIDVLCFALLLNEGRGVDDSMLERRLRRRSIPLSA